MKKVLVTGGAGYIGSHVTQKLQERDYQILIVDDFSNSSSESLLDCDFIEGNIGDEATLNKIFKGQQIESVLHFAGSIVVPESVEKPYKYYNNNTINSLKLINRAKANGVKNFIFSSTAAVYGNVSSEPVTEKTPTAPENPYAYSKLMTEQMLQDVASVSDLNFVILRYFNVAGAEASGKLGQRGDNATHLIKICSEAANKKRENVTIFGNDYSTPDGTGVRDYIHVEDLADVHVLALQYLEKGGESNIFNCGYSQGFSVKEVIEEVKKVSSHPFKVNEGPRRAGDVASLIADSSKLKKTLNWIPKRNNLNQIVKSAVEWEKNL